VLFGESIGDEGTCGGHAGPNPAPPTPLVGEPEEMLEMRP